MVFQERELRRHVTQYLKETFLHWAMWKQNKEAKKMVKMLSMQAQKLEFECPESVQMHGAWGSLRIIFNA